MFRIYRKISNNTLGQKITGQHQKLQEFTYWLKMKVHGIEVSSSLTSKKVVNRKLLRRYIPTVVKSNK